jgi:hypothetical protein
MKVLSIEPPVGTFDVPTKVLVMPSLYYLELLAEKLIGNHDVHILDMRIDEHLDAEISNFEPDVIGCSCVAANSHLQNKSSGE